MTSSFPLDQQPLDDGNCKVSEEQAQEAWKLDHSGERAGQHDLSIRYNRILNGGEES